MQFLVILIALVLLAGLVAAIAFGIARILRAAEGYGGLAGFLLKVAATVVGVGGIALLFWVVGGTMGGGGGFLGAAGFAFLAAGALVAVAVVFSIIWAPEIGGVIAKPFATLYDGGAVESKPQALYSIAVAKRKQGRYAEAIAEVRRQLERFPGDFPGCLMLAEIQAHDLHDLPAACATLEQFVSSPGHARKNVAYALNTLAEWHLKYSRDFAAAKDALERIPQQFPDSPEAHAALQRLAHFDDFQQYAASKERIPLAVPQAVGPLGLRDAPVAAPVPEADTAGLAAKLVAHLEQHPSDNEARERLALIYAGQFQRLDLALLEFEQLVAQTNAPAQEIVRWLNLMADLHVSVGQDLAAAEAALRRIAQLYPDSAAAHNAARRLNLLKFEGKRNETSQAVRLGSYEQNLGLRQGAPRPGERASD
jgi:tetratricopeptide (TPR) repeat protein